MAARNEITQALRPRYLTASRPEKTKLLDKFISLSGYHRKHAIRVLNQAPSIEKPDQPTVKPLGPHVGGVPAKTPLNMPCH